MSSPPSAGNEAPAAPASPRLGGFPAVNLDLLDRKGPPKTVVVIGAGLAGLAAAYQLARVGHTVRVVEARDRPGGRVETLRAPFEAGQHTEAGALFVPGHHPMLIGYATRFGLSLTPIQANVMCYVGGRLIDHPEAPDAPWPFPLWPAEQQQGLGGMGASYILPGVPQVGDPHVPGWPTGAARRLDTMTFFDFLRETGASPGAIRILRGGYFDLWGDGIDSCSALLILRDLAEEVPTLPTHRGRHRRRATRPSDGPVDPTTLEYTIDGGTDLLPRALAAAPELRNAIQYGTAVTRIEGGAGGARLDCVTARGERFPADQVICTVPFSVLRTMELDCPISLLKRRAIARLEYTSVTRVYLQTRTRLPNQTGLEVGTDLPLTFVHDGALNQPGPSGIVAGYAAGAAARMLAGLSEAERIRYATAALEPLLPGLTSQVVAGGSKCWDEDPWARGGYCWFLPGDMNALLAAIPSDEGPLHFAGDHTSTMPGWMEGAIESGHRAAMSVNDAP